MENKDSTDPLKLLNECRAKNKELRAHSDRVMKEYIELQGVHKSINELESKIKVLILDVFERDYKPLIKEHQLAKKPLNKDHFLVKAFSFLFNKEPEASAPKLIMNPDSSPYEYLGNELTEIYFHSEYINKDFSVYRHWFNNYLEASYLFNLMKDDPEVWLERYNKTAKTY